MSCCVEEERKKDIVFQYFFLNASLTYFIIFECRLIFGLLGAHLGGAPLVRGGLRVLIGGWIALGIAYGVGQLFNVQAA